MIRDTTSLQVERLRVGYHRRTVIRDLTLAPFHSGEITALIGPNATGKTTLLRALAGLQPAKGALYLGGDNLLSLPGSAHAARVTYMPQSLPPRVALTVFEATLSALKVAPGARQPAQQSHIQVMETLQRLGIDDLAHRPLTELSGGQRQLASLAQSVVREPTVLLLDEPTSALDLNYQFRVMNLVRALVRERGIIAVVVLHDIALASRWCDRVVVLSDGAVVADGPPATAVTADTLAQVYGVRARVLGDAQDDALQVIVEDVLDTGDATGQPSR
ncbi:ABC transporter ATP-binding protein [Rhodovibrio salinarum]|uniref:ABC transporter ATP-binding protein n=1 Tax=Rhodovibrio salinarum TaxID=1087 RepID=A0A934V0E9_9PROT|nr:ABC transporter ATP-binding protein [Rhodovibrio salinarum]MBK1697783.1 ABC transporter ATP-binding protein [Rhodovibrio salinarum]